VRQILAVAGILAVQRLPEQIRVVRLGHPQALCPLEMSASDASDAVLPVPWEALNPEVPGTQVLRWNPVRLDAVARRSADHAGHSDSLNPEAPYKLGAVLSAA
jgi:hypothetical protein